MTDPETPSGAGESPLRGRAVAVFGAGGFIGRRLVEKLVSEQGTITRAAVRNAKSGRALAGAGAHPIVANLRNFDSVKRAVSGCEIVFNLAYNFRATVNENLSSFGHLIEACRSGGVKLLVHTSSIAVYDDWPSGELTEESPCDGEGSDYKKTKRSMETELAKFASEGSLRSVVLQPTIVYGPRSWMWTDLIAERLLTGTVMLPDGGEGLCPAVYVDDVAEALILGASQKGVEGETFIVSGGSPVTWRAYFESIAKPLGIDRIQFFDSGESKEQTEGVSRRSVAENPLVRTALNRVIEIVGPAVTGKVRSILFERRRRRGGAVHSPGPGDVALFTSQGTWSIAKARSQLGYEPAFDFETGARLTARYLEQKFTGS